MGFIVVLLRTLGLVALFWSNWVIALICIVSLGLIAGENARQFALVKNTKLRITVEILTSIAAVAGIWFFPLIPVGIAQLAAVIWGITSLVAAVHPITQKFNS